MKTIAFGFALGLALCTLFAVAVSAATVRLYTPGGAPCAGACTLEWAAAEFDVPVGEPVPMVIPAGTMITKMSYAKDGKPMWLTESAVFAEDQPGQGYEVEIDGVTYWMVQIAECQNWALVQLPGFAMDLPGQPSIWTVSAPPPFYTPPGTPWTPPVVCTFGCTPPPCGSACEPPPGCEKDCTPQPPAVPLPAAFWSLLLGLGALGGRKALWWL